MLSITSALHVQLSVISVSLHSSPLFVYIEYLLFFSKCFRDGFLPIKN